nr:hypothetical protein [Candidatus Sigynarchaeota archaeon]
MQKTKVLIGGNPDLAVSDFSPSMIGAIRDVFGEEVLGIDGFHVMQELNNGIRRDLLDFRDNRFKIEIRELQGLRDWITRVQAGIAKDMDVSAAINMGGSVPVVNPGHYASKNSLEFTCQFLDIFKYANPNTFFHELVSLLDQNERT